MKQLISLAAFVALYAGLQLCREQLALAIPAGIAGLVVVFALARSSPRLRELFEPAAPSLIKHVGLFLIPAVVAASTHLEFVLGNLPVFATVVVIGTLLFFAFAAALSHLLFEKSKEPNRRAGVVDEQ